VARRTILALACCVVALAGCTRSGSPIGLHEVSIPLPSLHGPTVQGGELHAASLAGHVLVLNVWASWCGPCEAEQPTLETLATEYAARGVRFLGVQYRDDEAAGREWVRRFDVSYPSLRDPSGRTSADLGYFGLPDTYVTDRWGTIRFAIYGQTDATQLGDAIDRALALRPSGSS
jgi:cytochrome c biogenesis protein CcmG/thiol:disulfide interchange protein DsbE